MNKEDAESSGLLWGIMALVLIVGAAVMLNLAIMYSSVPHYEQQGWAEFCGLNAIGVVVLAGICIFIAGSSEPPFDDEHEKAYRRERMRVG